MSGKYALIIANTEYIDSGLAQLTAPSKDAEDFARVLKDKDFCAFDRVDTLVNYLSSSAIEVIDGFFDERKPDDLLVLYFSGHGVRDEFGSLYLAFRNTIRSRLRSTAIKDDYIRGAMDQSRSKRQVVFLDCCNSGAFPQGTKSETGSPMGLIQAFQGYGRFVLTASDATQFAWEGDKVIGETENSLFTHFLVKGLEGEADIDSDGNITVDELYDYTYEQISRVTPKQTPTKSASRQEGEIVLRQIMRIEDIKPVTLHDQLLSEIDNPYPEVRLRAVQQLGRLLQGKNLGLARSAREVLERMEREDDSRRVTQAAAQILEPVRQAAQRRAEEERLAQEKAEADRIAQQENQRIAMERENEERNARAKAEQERLAQEKIEAERLASQKAAQERVEHAKATVRPVVSLVGVAVANLRKLTPQRTLYFIIAVGLIVGMILGGRNIAQRNMPPGSTQTVSATVEPLIVAATTARTLTATSMAEAQPPLATTAVIETPSQTPSPSATSGLERYVYVTATKAYLYKGPDISFGLVVPIAYLRGEKFIVLARNLSGSWLFSQAADRNQGWLYRGWLDVSFDPLIIPTASFIPTIAPIQPTKPKGSGGDGSQPVPTSTCLVPPC